MEINEEYEINITDMSQDGNGIGRVDNFAVFVSGAVAGDTVTANVTAVKKNYAKAEAVKITEPSSDRIKSGCRYSDKCGGCAYRELSYEAGAGIKQKQIRDKLERIAKIKDPKVNNIILMDDPSRYRNKGEFSVKGGHAGPLHLSRDANGASHLRHRSSAGRKRQGERLGSLGERGWER